MITIKSEETKMEKFDRLINTSKLFLLEQQEWYLRNNRTNSDTRNYIFNSFKRSIIFLFGSDDTEVQSLLDELR